MKVANKKAHFKYNILDKFEAGVSLNGSEVKAFRAGRASLDGAFIRIMSGEMYLINAHLAQPDADNINPTRRRRLLMHRREIEKLESLIKAKKLTLIPLSMYTRGRLIKIEVAVVKAKRDYQKREGLKKRDLDRQMERELIDKDY